MLEPALFRPLPLLGHPDVQTILGALLPGRSCPSPQRTHIVPLGDGDSLLLHENLPPASRRGGLPLHLGPVALLVHGLTGSHRSPHVRRIASRLLRAGLIVYRIDLRGAGDGIPLARGSYHGGRSEDVRSALQFLRQLWPAAPLRLLGISLGGNMALKLAGELPEHPVPGLERVAAIAPPIDLPRCSDLITLPRNRFYEQRFARDLVRAALLRERAFPDQVVPRFPQPLTLRAFDDLYIAPRNGFASAQDYYCRASSFSVIHRIPLPTLILTARDDPFIAVEPFEELQVPEHVEVHIAEQGGHVGFVGPAGDGGVRWAERGVAAWLAASDHSHPTQRP